MLLMHLEMIRLLDTPTAISIPLLQLLVLVVIVGANPNPTPRVLRKNESNRSLSSPWLRRVINPRVAGCWNRPWICNDGKFPPRIKKMCCRNQCVDVTSDVYNCGLCGITCPFSWQCCRGICINTNINPFHCGNCETRCPFGTFCIYGMCGYAHPLPPFPFPPKPPKPPFPPKPFPPKPFPPKPFPPHHPPTMA